MTRVIMDIKIVSIVMCISFISCSSELTLDCWVHPNTTYQITKSTSGIVNSKLIKSDIEYEIAVSDLSSIVVSVVKSENSIESIIDGEVEKEINFPVMDSTWINPNYCLSDDRKILRSHTSKNSMTDIRTADPIKIWNDQSDIPSTLSRNEITQTKIENNDHSIIRYYQIDSVTPETIYLSYEEEVRYNDEGRQLLINNSLKKADSGRLEYDRINEHFKFIYHLSETKSRNQNSFEEKSTSKPILKDFYVNNESTVRISKLIQN